MRDTEQRATVGTDSGHQVDDGGPSQTQLTRSLQGQSYQDQQNAVRPTMPARAGIQGAGASGPSAISLSLGGQTFSVDRGTGEGTVRSSLAASLGGLRMTAAELVFNSEGGLDKGSLFAQLPFQLGSDSVAGDFKLPIDKDGNISAQTSGAPFRLTDGSTGSANLKINAAGVTGSVTVAKSVGLTTLALGDRFGLQVRGRVANKITVALTESRVVSAAGAFEANLVEDATTRATGSLEGTYTVASGVFEGSGIAELGEGLRLGGAEGLHLDFAQGGQLRLNAKGKDIALGLDGLKVTVAKGKDPIASATASGVNYDGKSFSGKLTVELEKTLTGQLGPVGVRVVPNGPVWFSYEDGKPGLGGNMLGLSLSWDGKGLDLKWPKWDLNLETGSLLGDIHLNPPSLDLSWLLDWFRGLGGGSKGGGGWPDWLGKIWGKLAAMSDIKLALKGFFDWLKSFPLPLGGINLFDLNVDFNLSGLFGNLLGNLLGRLSKLSIGPIDLSRLLELFDGLGFGGLDFFKSKKLKAGGLDLQFESFGELFLKFNGTELPTLNAKNMSATAFYKGKRIAGIKLPNVDYEGPTQTLRLWIEPSFQKDFGVKVGELTVGDLTVGDRIMVEFRPGEDARLAISSLSAKVRRGKKVIASGTLNGVGISVGGLSVDGSEMSLSGNFDFGPKEAKSRLKKGSKFALKVVEDVLQSFEFLNVPYALDAKVGSKVLSLSGQLERAALDTEGKVDLLGSVDLKGVYKLAAKKAKAYLKAGKVGVDIKKNVLKGLSFEDVAFGARLRPDFAVDGTVKKGGWSAEKGLSLDAEAKLKGKPYKIGNKKGLHFEILPDKTSMAVGVENGDITRVGGDLAAVAKKGKKTLGDLTINDALYDVAEGKISGSAGLTLADKIKFGKKAGIVVDPGAELNLTIEKNKLVSASGQVGVTALDKKGKELGAATVTIEEADFSGDSPLITGSAEGKSIKKMSFLKDALVIQEGGGFTGRVEKSELVEFTATGISFEVEKVLAGLKVPGKIPSLTFNLRGGLPDISFRGGSIGKFNLWPNLDLEFPKIDFFGGKFGAKGSGGFKLGKFGINFGVDLSSLNWLPKLKLEPSFTLPLMKAKRWFTKALKLLDKKINLGPFTVGGELGGEFWMGNGEVALTVAVASKEMAIDPNKPQIPDFEGNAEVTGSMEAHAKITGSALVGIGVANVAEANFAIPAAFTFDPVGKATGKGKLGFKKGEMYGSVGLGLEVDVPSKLDLAPYFKVYIKEVGREDTDALFKTGLSLGTLLHWDSGEGYNIDFGKDPGAATTESSEALYEPADGGLGQAEKQYDDKQKATPSPFSPDGAIFQHPELKHIRNIFDIAKNVFGAIGELVGMIREFIPPSFPGTPRAIIKRGKSLIRKVLGAWDAMKKAVDDGTLKWLWGIIPGDWKEVIDIFKDPWGFLTKKVKQAYNWTKKKIGQAYNAVKDAASDLVGLTSFGNDLPSKKELIIQFAKDAGWDDPIKYAREHMQMSDDDVLETFFGDE